MKIDLETAVNFILDDEGGYAERENEPGGAVNMGISFALFEQVWKAENKGIPTFADLKAMTVADADHIYGTYIFPAVSFDDLPVGLDYVMVNMATMQGPTGAIRLLQAELEVPITGKLDNASWAAIGAQDIYKMIGGAHQYQMQAKMHDPKVGPWIDGQGHSQHGFGPGWSDRIIRVWNRAKTMISSQTH